MFYLVTTPTCPNCPTAKQLVAEKNLEVTMVDASTESGLEFARRHHITSVPSIVETVTQGDRVYMGIEQVMEWIAQKEPL